MEANKKITTGKVDAVANLNRALIFSEMPDYAVNLLAQSLYYYTGNPDGVTRFIVDVQREAYSRTQAPQAKRLAERLAGARSEVERRKAPDKRR
jgi:hypothetical protein